MSTLKRFGACAWHDCTNRAGYGVGAAYCGRHAYEMRDARVARVLDGWRERHAMMHGWAAETVKRERRAAAVAP